MPKISVIIPAYNYAATLARAVKSIRTQSFKDVEIVIVNDASTDDTHDVAVALLDSKTTYIRNTVNLGLYATLTLGYKKAKGIFVCQLDCDDELTKDSLAMRYAFLTQNPVDAVCGGTIIIRDGTEKYIGPVQVADHTNVRNFLINGDENRGINSATFMFKRDIFDKIGSPNDTNMYFPHNDYEFSLRTILRCSVGVIDKPLYVYYVHSNSHSTLNGKSTSSKVALKRLKKMYLDLL